MQIHHYAIRFTVPLPREDVFAYLADARHLDGLTPDWLRFQVQTPMPVPMDVGTLIDYRLGWRGLPLRWRSEIVEWTPPRLFTYQQRRGPYRHFRHVHRFESVAEATRVVDEVAWAVWGGRLVARRVAVDLDTIFRGRVVRLASGLGVDAPEPQVSCSLRVNSLV